MTDQEYQIIWQKWLDPLGEDDLDHIHTDKNEQDFSLDNDIGDFYDDTNLDNEENETQDIQEENIQFYKKATRVIMTPMGIIPYTENTASNKIFNFWVGHTNFDITNSICSIIEKHYGIETLDIFTRYRFRISIGKVFNAADVMSELSTNIYRHLREQL